jgi:hypothetical protein
MLFALRALLSTVFLWLCNAWFWTRPAFSWEIWRLLLFFLTVGVITMFILGTRNVRWLYDRQVSGFYGLLVLLILVSSWMFVGSAFAMAMHTGVRGFWLICVGGLVAIVVGTWAVVWLAEKRGV